nr:anthocyanin 5-aromatic acyltransferase-like [Setaria viridis]
MSSQVRFLNISHVRPVQTAAAPRRAEAVLHGPGAGPHKKIQRLFFFDGPDLPPFLSVVSVLRSSLAATLTVFLPLDGELTFRPDSGDVVIYFSPAAISSSPGVKFVEAEFAGGADGMRHLARGDAHDTEAFARLVPSLDAESLPTPVLAVQVTSPADGGAAVAVVGEKDFAWCSLSHFEILRLIDLTNWRRSFWLAPLRGLFSTSGRVTRVSIRLAVAVGHAVWQFLRAWSTASREGPGSLTAPGFVQPTFARAGIRHPKSAEIACTLLSKAAPAPALPLLRSTSSKPEIMQQSARTFLLRADEIWYLKQHILERSRRFNRGEPSRPPSTYVAISSLAWVSIARAKLTMLHTDDARPIVIADCRNRLRPPLGDGFFGNSIKPCVAWASAGDLRAGVARAAAAIQDAIRVHLEELEGDPLSDTESWVATYGSTPPERIVAVGSSNRFMAYEPDFGWGGPSRVELVSLFVGQMVTLLGAGDGGVQVSVALDAAMMDAFAANFVVSSPISAVDTVDAGAVSSAR